MDNLISIQSPEDIPAQYHSTPIADLLVYHNLNAAFKNHQVPEMVIISCIDHRVRLNIPNFFAYEVRCPGANIRDNEFQVSYPLAAAKLNYLAVIVHSQCGMATLEKQKDQVVEGLERIGWNAEGASDHYDNHLEHYKLDDIVPFAVEEKNRLSGIYPDVTIAAMLYQVEDQKLVLIED